jgi:prepilin-type N-terminal cleavage/methylation domain-containing protein
MMPKYIQRHAEKAPGFSMIELMVVLAVSGILLSMAVPSVQNWRRNYNTKSAVTDLYASMQLARIGAIKTNRPWTVTFREDPVPSYEVRNADGTMVRQVIFANRYSGAVTYGSPNSAGPIDTPTVTFNQSGIADTGFVYLAGSNNSTYYRVGIPFMSSTVRIHRWNGSTWKSS